MFTRYQQIFGHRSFRLFWLGFTFSVLGDSLTRVALTWFVYETTKSAAALGWLMVCYVGPVVIGGLVAGSLLDRFDRRAVMIADNLIRGVAVASIPILYALGQLTLTHVYLVAAIYGLLMMISLAGSPALVPSLVNQEELDTANALETLSYTLGGILGPILAGLLIIWIGAPYVIIIDALSYLAFAFVLGQARLNAEAQPSSAREEKNYHTGHAVQLLLTNKILLSTTFMYMAFNIGSGFISVWLPIFTDQILKGGSELYGFLLGVMAVGEVISALIVGGRRMMSFSLGTLICMSQALSGLALVAFLTQNLWIAMIGLALFGAFDAPLTIWAQTLRMQIIPERLRGRTFALLRMLIQSGNPLGGAVAGWLLPVIGLPIMIACSACLIGMPGVIGYQVKTLRAGDVLYENQ